MMTPDYWGLQVPLGRKQIDCCVISYHGHIGPLGELREAGWMVKEPEIES